MQDRIALFLDTSALFAGIWSAGGGARLILKLGEVGVIRLLVSSHVLAEAQSALQRKLPDALGLFALLLDRSHIEVVPAPAPDAIQQSLTLTGHPGDAHVLAAAQSANVAYFITLDKQHFLDNSLLKDSVSFPVGTPGDCLAWLREQFKLDI